MHRPVQITDNQGWIDAKQIKPQTIGATTTRRSIPLQPSLRRKKTFTR
jgi:hypothetical protein